MAPHDRASGSGIQPRLEHLGIEHVPAETAGAAVTIVLRSGASGIEALLIERADRAGDPASGQVGLPGGHVENSDLTLAATALRELEEEVSLRAVDLVSAPRLFGVRRAARFGLDVAVFAAELLPRSPGPVPNPREVAETFWMPRSALDHWAQVTRESPVGSIEVPAVIHLGHVIWGFTYRVLLDFFRWWDGGPLPAGPSEPIEGSR